MDIVGKITGVKYRVLYSSSLEEFKISNIDINTAPSSFILNNKKSKYAVSKWVSPKRTRSYPYERVYNTLNISKKITIIPIIKDEGASGDRDFIQWDTISLMSLLDVYVIIAYYNDADAKNNKITNQKFDNKFIISKIKQIEEFHSSALHWNLNELENSNINKIASKAKLEYQKISNRTEVLLHSETGIDNFINRISKDVNSFMQFSRDKAKKAQEREIKTTQPKEALLTDTKAKITLTNYLGGEYYITVDETLLDGNRLNLIEGKHSRTSKLPSKGDIKDGLLKMILYTNICDVRVNNQKVTTYPKLLLTSSNLTGILTSNSPLEERTIFYQNNNIKQSNINDIETILEEAQINKFEIIIQYAK